MIKLLRLAILSISIGWFTFATFEFADAEPSCLAKGGVEELLSKAGVPVNRAQLLLMGPTPALTAETSDDQITQTSPAFANRNAKQLMEEDADWEKAQQFVKTLPLTEDNQNCLSSIQKIRDDIKKEVRQRDKENIPESFSPNELRNFRNAQIEETNSKPTTPNTGLTPHSWPSTGLPPPGPGNVVANTGKLGPSGAGWFGGPGEGGGGNASTPLHPVRAYLRAKDIPPTGAGAYGLVVFQSKATPASRSKLKMVCDSFVAAFPRNETSGVPLEDQMITIWPLDNPNSKEAKKDDCDFAIANYDLNAAEAAITDARRQHANFDGEGPYLVGWSPSASRGVPDKLVLVIDMSADNNQAAIDRKFRFWKNKIVEDPSLWRNGFSIENVREAIRIFADQYGQAMIEAIKLFGDKTSPAPTK